MNMNAKFARRTVRNLFFRNRPYFVHLCVTHRCNLRCAYCQVWQEHMPELDCEQTFRVLRTVDDMGCAVVSLTGGEPLLRKDIFDIIDYARGLGLHVRITTNGTLPLSIYERLLQTGIDAISVSVDGVRGYDLPHSKVSPHILRTLDYLLTHRQGQLVTVSTVLHNGNADQIQEIVEHVNRYDRTGVFVQPVVVGAGGHLRVETQEKMDPAFLKELRTLDPRFFVDGCIEYARSRRFDWRCKAGQLYFDIKPNGDFWICQDVPTGLNVLQPDFVDRWRTFDFESLRTPCSGCTYSCYYVTQEMFLPWNWVDMIATAQVLSGPPRLPGAAPESPLLGLDRS